MLLIGMCTSLTKKPTKPMIKNPIIVADAMRAADNLLEQSRVPDGLQQDHVRQKRQIQPVRRLARQT